MIPIKAASRNDAPRLILPGSFTVPSWYPLWQVSHRVIRLFGASPPVLRLSRWCTLSLLSLDFPLQHWQVCPSLNSTYSLTFQNPSCSPHLYSAPFGAASPFSSALIFCRSNDAVSTVMWLIGKILQISSTAFRWLAIFTSMEGASHPLCFDLTLLSNLALRYLVFRFLLERLYSLLSDSLSVTSCLSIISAA